jgi:hypothetical protein
MRPFKSETERQGLHITERELCRLRQHGLPPNAVSYVTIVLGSGRQTREDRPMLVPFKGYMRQIGVVECTLCLESKLNKLLRLGPYRDWYEGHTAKEKHWEIDKSGPGKAVGLRLRCFYSVYMDLQRQARLAHRPGGDLATSQLAKHGRIALVEAKISDILSVEDEGTSAAALESGLGPGGEMIMKVSRLKVLDLMDELCVVPSEAFLEAVLHAPGEWHRRWHRHVDAMQPRTWRDFLPKMAAALRLTDL